MTVLLRLLYLAHRVYLFIFRPVTFGVRVLLVKEGRVLLVRHTYMDGWYFPGGGLKRGETPEAAARREVREEAGVEAGRMELVGVYSNFKEMKSDHNILFLCSDFTASGKHDAEIAEARFFPLDNLPTELVDGHRRRIKEYLEDKTSPRFGEW